MTRINYLLTCELSGLEYNEVVCDGCLVEEPWVSAAPQVFVIECKANVATSLYTVGT